VVVIRQRFDRSHQVTSISLAVQFDVRREETHWPQRRIHEGYRWLSILNGEA